MMAQRLELGFELAHKSARVLWRVLSDEGPDISEVFFRLGGYAEDERSANFALPR